MGLGAWLLGVGAAIAGSLLAVSLLGQGIAPSTSQQLTAADVNNALATEASEASVPAISAPILPPSKPRARKTRAPAPAPAPTQVPLETGAEPSARPTASWPATEPSALPTVGIVSTPASTALTSQGGTVVADCQPPGAYLVSWSPAQGYEAGRVDRGPAAVAQVTFESAANSVTMVVSCSSGVPTATTTVSGGYGGGGGDE